LDRHFKDESDSEYMDLWNIVDLFKGKDILLGTLVEELFDNDCFDAAKGIYEELKQ